MATKQDAVFITLAALTMISFVVVQVACGVTLYESKAFWNNTNRTQDDTDLNPPGWAFSIWFVIYLWQFAWITYVLTSICRQYNGLPIYQELDVVRKSLLIGYIINQSLNVGFYVVYLYEMDELITMLNMFSLWITVLFCLVSYHYGMATTKSSTLRRLRKDTICLIVLVQNGLAIYISWLTMLGMLVINSFVVDSIGIPMVTASCGVLTLLAVVVTMYFYMELTFWRAYLKYTFTPYPAIMWGLMTITIDKWDPQNPTSIYVMLLLFMVSAFFFAKIGITVKGNKGKETSHEKYEDLSSINSFVY